jgi:DNA-binding Xre family transcriptional regulator
MKINKSKIKRWDFDERIDQIEKRLNDLKKDRTLKRITLEKIDEICQILEYWDRNRIYEWDDHE